MAVGLLATITIQEGRNEEFEEAFLDLTELVRANEPGNVFYALHRSPTDPQVYKVMEQYDSPGRWTPGRLTSSERPTSASPNIVAALRSKFWMRWCLRRAFGRGSPGRALH